MNISKTYWACDCFSVDNDEFSREQYRALEKEMRSNCRVDGPGSVEPREQTLMRQILIERGASQKPRDETLPDKWLAESREGC